MIYLCGYYELEGLPHHSSDVFFLWGIHFRSIYVCLDTLSVDYMALKEGQEKNVPDLRKNLDFLDFSAGILIDFGAFDTNIYVWAGPFLHAWSYMTLPDP